MRKPLWLRDLAEVKKLYKISFQAQFCDVFFPFEPYFSIWLFLTFKIRYLPPECENYSENGCLPIFLSSSISYHIGINDFDLMTILYVLKKTKNCQFPHVKTVQIKVIVNPKPPELEKLNIPHLKSLINAYLEKQKYGCGTFFPPATARVAMMFCMDNCVCLICFLNHWSFVGELSIGFSVYIASK